MAVFMAAIFGGMGHVKVIMNVMAIRFGWRFDGVPLLLLAENAVCLDKMLVSE